MLVSVLETIANTVTSKSKERKSESSEVKVFGVAEHINIGLTKLFY